MPKEVYKRKRAVNPHVMKPALAKDGLTKVREKQESGADILDRFRREVVSAIAPEVLRVLTPKKDRRKIREERLLVADDILRQFHHIEFWGMQEPEIRVGATMGEFAANKWREWAALLRQERDLQGEE